MLSGRGWQYCGVGFELEEAAAIRRLRKLLRLAIPEIASEGVLKGHIHGSPLAGHI
jgi:hypothetical protein